MLYDLMPLLEASFVLRQVYRCDLRVRQYPSRPIQVRQVWPRGWVQDVLEYLRPRLFLGPEMVIQSKGVTELDVGQLEEGPIHRQHPRRLMVISNRMTEVYLPDQLHHVRVD